MEPIPGDLHGSAPDPESHVDTKGLAYLALVGRWVAEFGEGVKPPMTPARVRGVATMRQFEKYFVRKSDGTIEIRLKEDCMDASWMLCAFASGKARPYPLLDRNVGKIEFPPAIRHLVTNLHVLVVACVAFAQLTKRKKGGLVIAHREMAKALEGRHGFSLEKRQTGDYMRECCDFGLLVARPTAVELGKVRSQRGNCYQLTTEAVRIFKLRVPPGMVLPGPELRPDRWPAPRPKRRPGIARVRKGGNEMPANPETLVSKKQGSGGVRPATPADRQIFRTAVADESPVPSQPETRQAETRSAFHRLSEPRNRAPWTPIADVVPKARRGEVDRRPEFVRKAYKLVVDANAEQARAELLKRQVDEGREREAARKRAAAEEQAAAEARERGYRARLDRLELEREAAEYLPADERDRQIADIERRRRDEAERRIAEHQTVLEGRGWSPPKKASEPSIADVIEDITRRRFGDLTGPIQAQELAKLRELDKNGGGK